MIGFMVHGCKPRARRRMLHYGSGSDGVSEESSDGVSEESEDGSGSDLSNYSDVVVGWQVSDSESDAVSDLELVEELDGWNSFGSEDDGDDYAYHSGLQNVEIPGSWGDEEREQAAEDAVFEESDEEWLSLHVKLHLVGEDLSDEGGTGGGAAAWEGSTQVATLPQDLVEAVLLRLPARAQARCRVVCRAWLATLSSLEFQRQSFNLSVSHRTCPIFAFKFSDGRYDDSDEDEEEGEEAPGTGVAIARAAADGAFRLRAPVYKTVNVPLTFLPQVFHSKSTRIHSFSPTGLICIGRQIWQTKEVYLCVVNYWSFKVLPRLFCPDMVATATLMVDSSFAESEGFPSFKIYVSDRHEVHSNFMLYSSSTGVWKSFRGFPNHMLELRGADLPFSCNGHMYTLFRSTRPRLVKLSTKSGPRYDWDLTLPWFGKVRFQWHWLDEFFLAEHRGRLLCCCKGIWMLDEARIQWVEVTGKCPEDLLPLLNPRKRHSLSLEEVRVAGDLVIFFYQLHIRRGKAGHYEDCPVAYNMVLGSWQKIPKAVVSCGDFLEATPDFRV